MNTNQTTPTPHGYWDCDCGRECRVKRELPDCRAEWVALPEPAAEQQTTNNEPFLAYTRRYGWVVVEKAPNGWTGYITRPGRYNINTPDIMDRAPLPPAKGLMA